MASEMAVAQFDQMVKQFVSLAQAVAVAAPGGISAAEGFQLGFQALSFGAAIQSLVARMTSELRAEFLDVLARGTVTITMPA